MDDGNFCFLISMILCATLLVFIIIGRKMFRGNRNAFKPDDHEPGICSYGDDLPLYGSGIQSSLSKHQQSHYPLAKVTCKMCVHCNTPNHIGAHMCVYCEEFLDR
jgi:hypothetical protein